MTRSTRLRDAALDAAESGLHVFPCVPRGKTPAVRDWEHVATRDAEAITAWWAHPGPPWNIGAAVGRSGIVVIDLDDGHGEPAPEPFTGASGGHDILAVLAARAGESIPITRTVATPSGGSHLYFRAPQGIQLRNTAAALGWRIDTRANGGYVVAAGSVNEHGMYRITDTSPIAELPGWLAEALTPHPSHRTASPQGQLPEARAGAYVRAIVEDETQAVAHARIGTRHHHRLKAARTLGQLVAGGELDEQTAYDVLRDAANGHIGIDCTEAEVENDIRHGLEYGSHRPRRVTKDRA